MRNNFMKLRNLDAPSTGTKLILQKDLEFKFEPQLVGVWQRVWDDSLEAFRSRGLFLA